MVRRARSLIFAAPLFVLWACGQEGRADPSGSVVVRDTVADTAVVRTMSGSAWGADAQLVPEVSIGDLNGPDEYLFGNVRSLATGPDGTIYAVDAQIPELRAYRADGTYLATLGGPGEGPGELKNPDGGLAVLSDGRILVRDPGNHRIQVYAPDGEALGTWPLPGGLNTSRRLFRDNDDNTYTMVLVDAAADIRDWQFGLVRFSADGVAGDTLVPPNANYDQPTVEARVKVGDDVNASSSPVPFTPTEEWALHPDGYFIHGVSTEYRFTLLREGSPLRVERGNVDRVPVAAGEKNEEEQRVYRNMRFMKPSWRWNGPAIPDEKPPYRTLFAGRDGRIWVMVSQPGVKTEDPAYDPTDPDAVPDEWHEPIAFDVFEDDGTYLGRVFAPEGFSPYPTPVFDGDFVWAVTRDEFDVNRVVRFRVERQPG